MQSLLFIILLLADILFIKAFAAPNVTGVSGTLSVGSQITITGSGFGTKSVSAPFLWDNFETGTNGSAVAGNGNWVEYSDPTSHVYTTSTFYSGTKSAHNHSVSTPGGDWFRAIGQKGLNSDVAYFSFYAKWRKYSGTYSGNTIMKFFRVNAQPDFYTSRPSQWFTIFPNNNDWFYSNGVNSAGGDLIQQDLCGGDGPACTQATMPTDNGPWGRFEFYYKLSTPGVANGLATSWWNYRKEYDLPNQMNRLSGSGGQHIDNFLIPAMNDEQGGNVLFDYYVDDVYVDTTPARVEICNTSTWSARTHCEIQIPSAWTSSSITVSTNLTGFVNGSTVYVYVLDPTNIANTNGYSKIIGETQSVQLQPPSNFRIIN